MSSELHLHGIGIRGYRGFGHDLQRIAPLARVNVFLGPNNSGKSNVLRFLHERLKSVVRVLEKPGASIEAGSLPFETHIDSNGSTPPFGFSLACPTSTLRSQTKGLVQRRATAIDTELDKLFRFLTRDHGLAWLDFVASHQNQQTPIDPDLVQKLLDSRINVSALEYALTNGSRSGSTKASAHVALRELARAFPRPAANVHFVPAHRRPQGGEIEDGDYSGIGIIARLAHLQSPPAETLPQDRARFKRISEFLQEVLGEPTAELAVPVDQKTLNVIIDEKALPLESLGSGVEEAVVLAAVATLSDNDIVCIEEPELHIHPRLQRQLLRYLQERTENQYFISSHSASVLDTPGAAVFRVSQEERQTAIQPVRTAHDRFAICADLGYRSSDLLQANAVIWVEGPSDRIYVRHWLTTEAPDLVEGIHYSIMFYGGRLLAHLSADDPEVSDFISLRRLNRNMVMLMDSDRPRKGRVLNETKRRIEKELSEGPGFVWITAGREVENYVPHRVLEEAAREAKPMLSSLPRVGRYENLLGAWIDNQGTRRTTSLPNKVKVARAATRDEGIWDVLDLRARVRKLTRTIREANE